MALSRSRSTVNGKRISSSVWQEITTFGVDLGDRFSRWCALDRDGVAVAEDRVATTTAAMAKLFEPLGRKRIAIETGNALALGQPPSLESLVRRDDRAHSGRPAAERRVA